MNMNEAQYYINQSMVQQSNGTSHLPFNCSQIYKLVPSTNRYTNTVLLSLLTSLASITYGIYSYKQYQYKLYHKSIRPQFTIRHATIDESDTVAQSMYDSFTDFMMQNYNKPAQPLSRYSSIVKRGTNSNHTINIVIAVNDNDNINDILGCIIYDTSDIIIGVQSLTIAPSATNYHIATDLIQYMINECNETYGNTCIYALTQFLGNYKAQSLYTKNNFVVQMHCSMHCGLMSTAQIDLFHNQLHNNNIIVSGMKHSDIDECDQLHSTVLGCSRLNNITCTYNESITNNHITIVARNKLTNELIGYCTTANTSEGFWIWNNIDTFQSMYMYAQQQAHQLNHPSIILLMQHKYNLELHYLLSCKHIYVVSQLTVMYCNYTIPKQNQYCYAPSSYY